jgi:hypothetical protein
MAYNNAISDCRFLSLYHPCNAISVTIYRKKRPRGTYILVRSGYWEEMYTLITNIAYEAIETMRK